MTRALGGNSGHRVLPRSGLLMWFLVVKDRWLSGLERFYFVCRVLAAYGYA